MTTNPFPALPVPPIARSFHKRILANLPKPTIRAVHYAQSAARCEALRLQAAKWAAGATTKADREAVARLVRHLTRSRNRNLRRLGIKPADVLKPSPQGN